MLSLCKPGCPMAIVDLTRNPSSPELICTVRSVVALQCNGSETVPLVIDDAGGIVPAPVKDTVRHEVVAAMSADILQEEARDAKDRLLYWVDSQELICAIRAMPNAVVLRRN